MENQAVLPPIKERVKSYEDACAILGRTPLTEDQFAFMPDGVAHFNLHKITTAIEALNEGHVFDWNNYDEKKYYPWFDMETYGDAPAGSGFSYYYYGCDGTISLVGARLSVRTADHAEYIGTQFLPEYKAWMKK